MLGLVAVKPIPRLPAVMTSSPTTATGSGMRDGASTAGLVGMGLVGLFIYLLVIGGTGRGEVQPVIRSLNAVIGAVLLAVYVLRAPSRADRFDRAALAALVLFAVAGALSQLPRQSFDAVLGAAAYAAGFFVVREHMANAAVRVAFVRAAIALSALFTLGAVLLWAPLFIDWWAITGWTVVPPLNLPYSGGPWGHRYDIGLLLALLYPAWWIGRPSVARRVVAVVIGVLGVAVIGLTGSRTVWIALVVATLVVVAPPAVRFARRRRRVAIGVVVAAAMLAVAAVAVGAARPLIERALSLESLDWRLAMWGPLTNLWLEHPVAGVGPGAFPWSLQLTGYFDANTWAPRHPDNAVMQLLPEAGALGLLALAVLIVTFVPALVRTGSAAIRWVVVLFLVACIGANPTDFAYLVVVLIAWVAYALPRAGVPVSARRSPITVVSMSLLAVVFVAHGATLVAGFAYESARSSVADGALADAEADLTTAMRLDPGMALYARQRGALRLAEGRPEAAIGDLRAAVRANPADDVARRSLGAALAASGDFTAALREAEAAVGVQRSDPSNLLLAAWLHRALGDEDAAVELLVETVHAWPWTVASPGWAELLPPDASTAGVVDGAMQRWGDGAASLELPSDQGVWLGVLSGDAENRRAAVRDAPMSGAMAEALAGSLACEDVSDYVAQAPAAERRSPMYWLIRIRDAARSGSVSADDLHALRIMTGGSYAPADAYVTWSAVNENWGLSADRWGYRRDSMHWPQVGPRIPAVWAGYTLWLLAPSDAATAAGLLDRLPECDR